MSRYNTEATRRTAAAKQFHRTECAANNQQTMALKHVIVLACACATASAYVAPSRRGARATPLRVATLEKEEKVAVAVEAAVDDLVVAPAIEAAVAELVEEECEVEEPEPECLDEAKLEETRGLLRRLMRSSVSGAGGKSATAADTAPADGDVVLQQLLDPHGPPTIPPEIVEALARASAASASGVGVHNPATLTANA